MWLLKNIYHNLLAIKELQRRFPKKNIEFWQNLLIYCTEQNYSFRSLQDFDPTILEALFVDHESLNYDILKDLDLLIDTPDRKGKQVVDHQVNRDIFRSQVSSITELKKTLLLALHLPDQILAQLGPYLLHINNLEFLFTLLTDLESSLEEKQTAACFFDHHARLWQIAIAADGTRHIIVHVLNDAQEDTAIALLCETAQQQYEIDIRLTVHPTISHFIASLTPTPSQCLPHPSLVEQWSFKPISISQQFSQAVQQQLQLKMQTPDVEIAINEKMQAPYVQALQETLVELLTQLERKQAYFPNIFEYHAGTIAGTALTYAVLVSVCDSKLQRFDLCLLDGDWRSLEDQLPQLPEKMCFNIHWFDDQLSDPTLFKRRLSFLIGSITQSFSQLSTPSSSSREASASLAPIISPQRVPNGSTSPNGFLIHMPPLELQKTLEALFNKDDARIPLYSDPTDKIIRLEKNAIGEDNFFSLITFNLTDDQNPPADFSCLKHFVFTCPYAEPLYISTITSVYSHSPKQLEIIVFGEIPQELHASLAYLVEALPTCQINVHSIDSDSESMLAMQQFNEITQFTAMTQWDSSAASSASASSSTRPI